LDNRSNQSLNDLDYSGEARSSAGLADLTGQQVGRYRVERFIGSGGVATVYQAYDQVQGITVALKVLLPHADEKTYSRFRREALTAGALRHEHIVRVLQVGTLAQGGIAYIAMELVDGDSLSALLSHRGTLHPQESCNLLEPIARALAFAHQAGIVHRDVKPSNILLRTVSPGAPNSVQLESLDHPVVPVLTDFGVARFLDAPELTSTGRTVGTPAYMAPEQCAGKRDVNGRTDIYALGAVLYRCLTGRLPFSGSVTQILHAHVYEPLTIDNDVLQRLPPTMVEILRRSLAKNPVDRYASADELAQALALAAGRIPIRPNSISESTGTLTLNATTAVRPPTVTTATTVLVPGVGASSEPMPKSRNMPLGTRVTTSSAGAPVTPPPPTVASVGLPAEERFYRLAWRILPIALLILLFAIGLALWNSPFGFVRWSGEGNGANNSGGVTLPSPTGGVAVNLFTATPTATATPVPPTSVVNGTSTQITNTPSPVAITPTATETATPTFSPTPTPLPSDTPTAVPSFTPTASATPSPTATATPLTTLTATPTNLPPGCNVPVAVALQSFVANLDSSLHEGFACPLEAEREVNLELLRFEYGYMLRFADQPDQIFVNIYIDDHWEQHGGDWSDDSERLPPVPPPDDPTRSLPKGAFGRLWHEKDNGRLQQQLGYAIDAGIASSPGQRQLFPGGLLGVNLFSQEVFPFVNAKRR
jgi:serine/threonine-protein kinase